MDRESPTSAASTLSSTSPTKPYRTPTEDLSPAPSSMVQESTSPVQQSRIVPLFDRPPVVMEIIEVRDVERGAIDMSRTRIVSSARFTTRKGADRQVSTCCSSETELRFSSTSRHPDRRARRRWCQLLEPGAKPQNAWGCRHPRRTR